MGVYLISMLLLFDIRGGTMTKNLLEKLKDFEISG